MSPELLHKLWLASAQNRRRFLSRTDLVAAAGFFAMPGAFVEAQRSITCSAAAVNSIPCR